MRLTPQFAALFTAGIVAAGILAASTARAGFRGTGWRWPRSCRSWRSWRRGARCGRWGTSSGSTSRSARRRRCCWRLWRSAGPAARAAARDHAAAAARRVLVQPLPDPRADRGHGQSCVRQLDVGPGMPTFLVTLGVAVPLAVVFAWSFASLFEIPFQRHRSWAAWRAVVSGRWSARASAQSAPGDVDG